MVTICKIVTTDLWPRTEQTVFFQEGEKPLLLHGLTEDMTTDGFQGVQKSAIKNIQSSSKDADLFSEL